MLRIVAAAATITVFTVTFATTDGENVQSVSIPISLIYGIWWALGPLLPLAFARPSLVAAAIWAAALVASLLALRSVYSSTSSTSGIGLFTLPLAIASCTAVVTVMSRWMLKRRRSHTHPPGQTAP